MYPNICFVSPVLNVLSLYLHFPCFPICLTLRHRHTHPHPHTHFICLDGVQWSMKIFQHGVARWKLAKMPELGASEYLMVSSVAGLGEWEMGRGDTKQWPLHTCKWINKWAYRLFYTNTFVHWTLQIWRHLTNKPQPPRSASTRLFIFFFFCSYLYCTVWHLIPIAFTCKLTFHATHVDIYIWLCSIPEINLRRKVPL